MKLAYPVDCQFNESMIIYRNRFTQLSSDGRMIGNQPDRQGTNALRKPYIPGGRSSTALFPIPIDLFDKLKK